MEFKKYSSIENTYRSEIIERIRNSDLCKEMWQITEKIHGSNFSYWYDGNEMKFASRNEFKNESFYNAQSVISKYTENIKQLYINEVKEGFLIVFGELFGPGIQKGVNYGNLKDFRVFDIFSNGEYFNTDQTVDLCLTYNLLHVPVIHNYCSFDEALEYPSEFKSLVFPVEKEENISEGIVLKPVNPRYFGNGSRVILKKKNEKFKEVSREKRPKIKVDLPPEIIELVEQVSDYITLNRITCVASKLGELNPKDFMKLNGLFMKDIFNDYEKETKVCLKDKVGDCWKLFNKEIKSETVKITRKFLFEN